MIITILDYIFMTGAIGILISIVSFVFMMIFVKRLNPYIILVMISVLIVTPLAGTFIPSLVRSELHEKLGGEIISVVSQRGVDKAKVLHNLKDMSSPKYNNTHPLERFMFKVKTAEEEIYLELARDSNDNEVYWVYYPKYYYSGINDVGKIKLSN